MGVMKRIATARIWNENLTGRRESEELAAMYRIWKASEQGRDNEHDAPSSPRLATTRSGGHAGDVAD